MERLALTMLSVYVSTLLSTSLSLRSGAQASKGKDLKAYHDLL